jgi:hypothetical protein
MAFQIDKEHRTLTLSYWRVAQVNVSEDGSGRVALHGYRSEAERDADVGAHYDLISHSFGEDVYADYFAPEVCSDAGCNRVAKAYDWISTLDEWEEAADV